MELQKKDFVINKLIKSGCHEVPVDGDIIVPDIKPDILKILQINGTCIITGKDVTEGKISIDGRVDFNIMYTPDSESEKIKSISSFFDFSHHIDNENISPDCYIQLDCDISRIDFQLINSRKLRIKSMVELNFETGILEQVSAAVEADESGNPQILKNTFKSLNILGKAQNDFTIHEKVELPSGQSSIKELLRTDIKIVDKEFKSISGRIVAKGIFDVNLLYIDSEGCIRFCDHQIPFTEIFDVEGVFDDALCEVDFTFGDISARVTEDNDGDMRIVDLDVLVFANITASEENELEYISDIYYPGYNTSVQTTERKIDVLCCRTSAQQTVRDVVIPQKTAPAIHGIYYVPAKTSISKTTVSNGKTTVEGNIICFVLYTSDSNDSPLCSLKKEIPFAVTAETPGSSENMICEIRSELSRISYSINSAGEAELRAVLSLDIKIYSPSKISFIDDTEIEDLPADSKKGIVLYFVQPNDTLWSISKEYSVAKDEICELNKLESDNLSPGVKLVIPAV